MSNRLDVLNYLSKTQIQMIAKRRNISDFESLNLLTRLVEEKKGKTEQDIKRDIAVVMSDLMMEKA